MKNLMIFCFLILCGSLHAQLLSLNLNNDRPYNQAAAILYNGQMLVSEYSIYGECKLEQGQKGYLSVSTITLTPNNRIPIDPVQFQVAFKNNMHNTIRMFDNNIYSKVEFEDVFDDMVPGDSIILLTTDKQYILMHNEIKVLFGC